MRDYGRIAPSFWTRGSGKKLRGDAVAQAVASYLCTGPNANMIGLYYVPLASIANDTGHPVADVRAALQRIEETGFAFYDFENEIVFVPNGAVHQIGETLHARDKRVAGVARELRSHIGHRFVEQFLDLYAESYCLSREDFAKGSRDSRKGLPVVQKGPIPDPDPPPVPDPVPALGGAGGTAAAPAESGTQVRARRVADPFGDESIAGAWQEGLTAGSGAPVTRPSPPEVRKLVSVVDAHCGSTGLTERASWAHAAGRAFGAVVGSRKRSVYAFADWQDAGRSFGGRPDPQAWTPPPPPRAPASLPPKSPDMTPEERASLSAAFQATIGSPNDVGVVPGPKDASPVNVVSATTKVAGGGR